MELSGQINRSGWRSGSQRNFTEAPELIENLACKLRVELLILGHIRLHGSNPERLCRWRNLGSAQAESENAHDCCQC